MTDTATQILDTAQELIQTQGYTAMSFQDIAEIVGIKKPSIIHHFPSKAALGEAVIKRYRLGFADQMDAIKADPAKTVWDALEFYFSPYLDYAGTPDKVCLCGALAGEIMALPENMREEVKCFMKGHQRWLEDILREGKENGQFHFDETPPHLAKMFFSALQGALLVKRSTEDTTQVRDVANVIKAFLNGEE